MVHSACTYELSPGTAKQRATVLPGPRTHAPSVFDTAFPRGKKLDVLATLWLQVCPLR